jgi:3-oxoacyl-[acyl-carrier-protein] synthase II
LNFETARPGCDLDYVPNQARAGRIDAFLSNSAAFGGVNAVAVGGRLRPAARGRLPLDDVLVTGLGVLSPLGFHPVAFANALRERITGITAIERFACADCRCRHAGVVRGFNARKLDPTVDVRRMDTLTQYAVVATSLALKDAGLKGRTRPPRMGLTVALTRGPVATQERFLENLGTAGIQGLSAKYFPAMVLSTLSGQVAQACQIKGASLTIVDGRTASLQALVDAAEYLRQSDELDALVVVAADELGSHYYRLFSRLGMLPDTERYGTLPRPYDQAAGGPILGEGAAALVLERRSSMAARRGRAYGRIAGYGRTADAQPDGSLEAQGEWLERAARQALEEAAIPIDAVDAVYGHGCGDPGYDRREVSVLERLLGGCEIPVGCVVGNLGLAEAASGLFTAAAALLGMHQGEVFPVATLGGLPASVPFVHSQARAGELRRTLVLGSTEHGNNTALLLSRGAGGES